MIVEFGTDRTIALARYGGRKENGRPCGSLHPEKKPKAPKKRTFGSDGRGCNSTEVCQPGVPGARLKTKIHQEVGERKNFLDD
jgi:hypothetical protein